MATHPTYLENHWGDQRQGRSLSHLADKLPPMIWKSSSTPTSSETIHNLLRTLKLTGPVLEYGTRKTTHRTIFSGQRKKLRDDLQQLNSDVTRESALAFGKALWEQWTALDHDTDMGWLIWGAGFFGDDHMTLAMYRFMCDQLKRGKAGYRIADCTLGALMSIDTPMARMTLASYASSTRYNSLTRRAKDYIEGCAREEGLSVDELEDQCIPDFGLDVHGTRHFSYGSRSFQVTVGENFYPVVRDEDGKNTKNLPRMRKSDDVEMVDQAKQEWDLLKGSLIHTFKIQFRRLEKMMLTRRTWHFEAWKRHMCDHRVMYLFAKNLLWRMDVGGEKICFRVAEDRSFASVDDEPLELPSHGLVELVHPLHLSARERERWGELFLDYELVSPVEQLGRQIHPRGDEEAFLRALYEDVELEPKWVRISNKMMEFNLGSVNNYSVQPRRHFFKEIVPGSGVELHLHLTPGLHPKDYRQDEPQRVESVRFTYTGEQRAKMGCRDAKHEALTDLVWNEAIHTLSKLLTHTTNQG